jgi:NADPH:quinone reductase-like Zn-dependent oxidoreductase
VAAIGLNFADLFTCLGLYNAAPKADFVPGLEFSGVVEATGPDCCRGLQVGDHVMGVTRFGAYATHLNVNEILVRPHTPTHAAHGVLWRGTGTVFLKVPGKHSVFHAIVCARCGPCRRDGASTRAPPAWCRRLQSTTAL